MLRALLLAISLGTVFASSINENDVEEVKKLVARHVKRAVAVDFDEHARQWVENQARSINRGVWFWDLYAKHEHLASRPHYHKYKINVYTENLKYGNVQQTLDQPQQVYSKWYCNNMKNQPMTTTVSREVTRSNSYTWSTSEGIKIGATVNVQATIPGIMGFEAGLSTELDMTSSRTNAKEDIETFKIEYDLTIDPQTAVKADWIITEREIVVPYEADVHIDGYVAVWYHEKYNNHWLWFYPTWYLAGGKFRQAGSGLIYTAKGVFRGVRGVDSVIRIEEHPVREGKCKEGAQYYGPISKIKHEKLPFGRYPLSSGTSGD